MSDEIPEPERFSYSRELTLWVLVRARLLRHDRRVNHQEIDDDLPILEFYLADVLRQFKARRTKARRKVSRTLLLRTFLRTHDIRQTAQMCGVSASLVRQVISSAIYMAKRIAGLWPPPDFEGDAD